MKKLLFASVLIFSNFLFSQEYWIHKPSPTTKFLTKIQFVDTLFGWAAGDSGIVIHTSDGGGTWTIQNTGIAGYPVENIFFLNRNIGWGVANDYFFWGTKILRTTNGGLNWDLSIFPDTAQVFGTIYFLDSLTGYLSGYTGTIFKTTNGGFNWLQQAVPISGFRRDFWFENDTVGWVVGGGGYILKTTNGGTYVGVEPISNEIPKDFNLGQNYPNPFNPMTEIKYELPKNSFVTIKIYNTLGEEITRLVNYEYKSAGRYSISFDGTNYASGIYFYSIEAGTFKQTKKMILIK